MQLNTKVLKVILYPQTEWWICFIYWKSPVTWTLCLSLWCRTGLKCSQHHFPQEPQGFFCDSSPVFWSRGSVLCNGSLIIAHDCTRLPSSMSFNTVLIMYSIFSFKGCINIWQVLRGGKFVSSFKAVRYFTLHCSSVWLLDIQEKSSSFTFLSLKKLLIKY